MKNNADQPDAYKKGWIEFYKLKFKVTKDVLIPRPETELLVDEILKYCNLLPATCPLILDLGTGSGAIAISIAKNLYPTPGVGVKIIASDISEKALKVTKQNAKLHNIEKQIIFLESDLLACFSSSLQPTTYNLQPNIIVTNLPYIPTARIPFLDSSVKDFEPHIALDGGDDGFELYRKLFYQIVQKKWKPKLIVGEIDYTHGELAVSEAQKYFPNAEVEVKKDLAHLQRVLIIKQP